MKHSGLGIASFILSLTAGAGTLVLGGIAAIIDSSTSGGIDEESTEVIVVALLILAAGFANFIALGLGVAGVLQSDRKKVFAVLGTVFSTFWVLAFVGLLVFALLMA